MSKTSIEERLRRLEDLEAIRALKARYLAACDGKDPAAMRGCFADGEVAIDYGVVGKFSRADELVAIFKQLGCHEHIVEMHHGVNPDIAVHDAGHAQARWGLHYQQINTREQTLTQLAGEYEDEYRCQNGTWKISATRFTVTSTLVLKLDEAALKSRFAGRQMPT